MQSGFEPLAILVKDPGGYVKWHCDLRCEPQVQLQYGNPVINECDYVISNTGPAAYSEGNTGKSV